MASLKTFQLIATKLELSHNDKVLSKAAEYERLLQSKSVAGSNMTDTAKVVICLDLAASFHGVDLDLKTAVKYSGLKGPSYSASKKMVENLVEHNTEKLIIPSLCLALQCTTAQGLAEKILNEYQNQSKMAVDLNLPQYVCMAVYHACRLNKVKVSKSKLIEKSRLKPAQWSKLAADWTTFVDEIFNAPATAPKKRGRPKKQVLVEEDTNKMDVEESKKEDECPQMEPYEEWRTRMLEQAYRELKEVLLATKHLDSPVKSVPKYEKDLNSPKKNVVKFGKDLDSPKKKVLKFGKDLDSPKKNVHSKDLDSPMKRVAGKDLDSAMKCLSKHPKDLDSPMKSVKKDLNSPRKVQSVQKLENEKLTSPRRSPRKTLQISSPFKDSPKKGQGVRLLFPL